MSSLPHFHIVVMQPAGYLHSLGLLDPARYLRYQLRRLGATVTLAKNRLREDAINIVFAAHLGFPSEVRDRHTIIFFNLEQLGDGGAALAPDYLRLLSTSAVIDYDAENIGAYSSNPSRVPVVPLGHAPYLAAATPIPLAERPIDLLFFGTVNPRRQALFDRIEACGVAISTFDTPLYGPERDDFIRQAKAVLNCHFYDTSRFEQARVSHCLSLGTPVVSERHPLSRPGDGFLQAVGWFDDSNLESFFADHFGSLHWLREAEQQLDSFRAWDPLEACVRLIDWAVAIDTQQRAGRDRIPPAPLRINLGSGKDYRLGWLNIDVQQRTEPDLVLDLAAPITLPLSCPTRFGGQVTLDAGTVDTIHASNVLEHVPDLPQLMGNALRLLRIDGEFEIEVPYEKALTAWQDPTHVRAMNENSWVYYTDWFWYLGWFEHRFELNGAVWLDGELRPCTQDDAAFMKVRLRKIQTTPRERTLARTMSADFGAGIDDDVVQVQPREKRPPTSHAGSNRVGETPPQGMPPGKDAPQPAVDAAIGRLLDAGDAREATEQLVAAASQRRRGDAAAPPSQRTLARLDRHIERLAEALAHDADLDALQACDGGTLLFATHADAGSEHALLLRRLAAREDRPVLVLTDLRDVLVERAEQVEALKQFFAGIDVLVLPLAPAWEKCGMVKRVTEALRPRRIVYLADNDDPVPFIGSSGLGGPDKLFVRRDPTRPSIGATLKGLTTMIVTGIAQRSPPSSGLAACGSLAETS
ncbi:methyltransferase domain-containing protein [Piscinibacter sakaiensis]|uniref:methyltransferase domain-containing protein n=1 Tax=Piscinibacter sakaiensis TaxID=1547922 RepID=UPI003AADA21B